MMSGARQTILVRSLAAAFASSTAFVAPHTYADDDVQIVQVTAQSRQQQVKDVPITMQVVTAKDIGALGANNLSDLNGYIPGFTASAIEPTQPEFTIRGVQGGGDFGIGTDSPVGIYEDGIYTGKTGGALMNFIDVQRVEVIKGPQGTLFGRNSAAGAISVVTNEPTQELDMLAHLKVGEYRTATFDAMVNVPLSDTSAVRLVVARNASNGWVTNQATSEEDGGNDDWATRLSYKKNLGAIKFNLSWEHEELSQDGRPVFGAITNPALPLGGFTGSYTPAYIGSFANPFSTPLNDASQGLESRIFNGVTMRVEAPLGDMTFNSTTGYRAYHTWDATDESGTGRADVTLVSLDAKKAHSLQQEFKLSGKNGTMDWIGGLSFYYNNEDQISGATSNTATIDTLNLLNGGSPGNTFTTLFTALGALGAQGINASTVYPWAENTYSKTITQSASLYGDSIWHLTSSTNLTAGLRWSEDQKTMTWYTPGRMSPQLDAAMNSYGGLIPAVFGGPFTPASFPPNIVLASTAQYSATPVSRSKTWSDFSPRLVLDHKYDSDTMVFASLAQGYQAGGFNVFTPPNPASANPSAQDPSFKPEKMTNLELGTKLSFPSLRASLNASLFAYRFNNLQNITLQGTPGSIPTYNITTSDQKATGLDMDGRIRVSNHIALFGGFEYIDASYTKYDQTGDSGIVTNLSGQPVGTPYFTGMAGTNVTWDALNGHASWSFQGTHTSAQRRCSDDASLPCLSTSNLETGAAITKFDTRLGWLNEDRRYGVALLVNNVFNQRYVQFFGGQLTSIGVPYSIITPPRFAGIEFTAQM
ncbi:MAG TPA: TonB-dependent receptor [Burkholderiaceae bacterium]|jgi:iron complex outermembrane receptor protein|nr:TonB-dependent receptor [Burkholderiaceae bacterium]